MQPRAEQEHLGRIVTLVSMKRPAPSASAWIIHPWRTEPTYGGAGPWPVLRISPLSTSALTSTGTPSRLGSSRQGPRSCACPLGSAPWPPPRTPNPSWPPRSPANWPGSCGPRWWPDPPPHHHHHHHHHHKVVHHPC